MTAATRRPATTPPAARPTTAPALPAAAVEPRPRPLVSLIALVTVVVFLAASASWLRVGAFEIGRSDFTNAYVGGTLLRTGHAGQVYDEALQTSLHSALIAPDTEGNLPFLDSPPAAVLAAPVTLLPLETAYRIWGALQLLMVVAAVFIVARVAPWDPRVTRGERRLVALAAAAGVGTEVLLLQAQWDGINTLSLALAYAAWRTGRPAWAGAALAVGAGLAKPHLALGLAVFLVVRWKRAELAGAAAATLALAAASRAAVGPAGLHGFVSQISSSTLRFHLGEYISATGLAGVVLGDTTAAVNAGLLAGAVVLAAVGWVAWWTRGRDGLLEPAFAVAVVGSLLASPHLLFHDLALLSPAVVWWAAAMRRERMPAALGRIDPLLAVLCVWLVVNLVARGQAGSDSAGAVVPWVLAALGVAAAWPALPRSRRLQVTSAP